MALLKIKDISIPARDWRWIASTLLEPEFDLSDLDYEGVLELASTVAEDEEKIFMRMIMIGKNLMETQNDVIEAFETLKTLSHNPCNAETMKKGELKTIDTSTLLEKGEMKKVTQDELDRYIRSKQWSLDKVLKQDYEKIRILFYRVTNGVEVCDELYKEFEILAERSIDIYQKILVAQSGELADNERIIRLNNEMLESYISSLGTTLFLIELNNRRISDRNIYFSLYNNLIDKYMEYLPNEHQISYQ